MRRVLVREQAPELGVKGRVLEGDLAKEACRLGVVLPAAPFAEAEPTDGVSGGGASEDGECGRNVRLSPVLSQDEPGDVEECSRLVAARAAFGR